MILDTIIIRYMIAKYIHYRHFDFCSSCQFCFCGKCRRKESLDKLNVPAAASRKGQDHQNKIKTANQPNKLKHERMPLFDFSLSNTVF